MRLCSNPALWLRDAFSAVLACLPISSEYLGPPKHICETTKTWVDGWNAKRRPSTAGYTQVYPRRAIERCAPKTVYNSIHWQFKTWNASYSEQPGAFVANIPGGRVYGPDGAVITPDDILLADVSIDFGVVAESNPMKHSVRKKLKLPPVQYLDRHVAVLSVLGGTNYYHWMFDLLPRLDFVRYSGCESVDLFVVNRLCSTFQSETLAALGIAADRVLESDALTHVRARVLILPSRSGRVSDMSQWACDFLRKTFLPSDSRGIEQFRSSGRIYISRAQARYRRVINEDDVMSLLRRFGFERVVLERLSVADQASLFASARVIIAPHGAGLTNLVFCKPRVKVIEVFGPQYVNCCYWTLSYWMEAEYVQPPNLRSEPNKDSSVKMSATTCSQ